MHTFLNSQHPHLPVSRSFCRKLPKTSEFFQISANCCVRRSPAFAGRYPQGKTSPSCEMKQTPVPARQPFVTAFIAPGSDGCPPVGCPGCPGCPRCPALKGAPLNEMPVEPGIVISIG